MQTRRKQPSRWNQPTSWCLLIILLFLVIIFFSYRGSSPTVFEEVEVEDGSHVSKIQEQKALYHTLWTEPDIEFEIENVLKDEPFWTKVSDQHKANLLWVRNEESVEWDTFNGRLQWANRFFGEGILTTKGALADVVYKYQERNPDARIRVPKTFLLYDPEQCKRFEREARKPSHANSYWIVKHTHLSRGKGASVHQTPDLLGNKEYYDCDNPPEQTDDVPEGNIVQEYIAKPLLLEGYKSEVRFYWIIASLDPWIVLLYPNATVRRTSQKYNLDDLKNPKIHLANVYQQKKGADYVDLDSLKWTLPMLEDYLIEQGKVKKGWMDNVLRPMARRYLYDAYMSCRDQLGKVDGTFSLLGVDLLFDENMNMYLLEVQKNPGMSTGGVKKFIIPPLLRKTVSLVLQLGEKKRSGESLCSKNLDLSDWILIHNEADSQCSK